MALFATILALLIGIFAIVFLVSLLYSAFVYVPFVPTPLSVVRKMVDAAEIADGQRIYDLGCGDGRLLIEASKGKKVIAKGFEINPFVYFLGKLRVLFSHQKVQIHKKNFERESLHDADVIFCYLFPHIMQKLSVKFQNELRKGARIVSYCFPLKGRNPKKIIPTRDDKPNNFLIYVYEI